MASQTKNLYLALPDSGKGTGVLVLHAWWGLNQFMRDFCDRLAQEGFVALAPDLFHGSIAHTVEEADKLSSGTRPEQVAEDILSAADVLRGISLPAKNGLGTVGFSFGAYWALWLAHERPDDIRAVTVFYGTGYSSFAQSKAAYLGHFAEKDPFETLEGVKELEKSLQAASRPVSFYVYPGTGHWFFEEDRQDAYNAQAAKQAWERTAAFLHQYLEDTQK